MISSLFNSGPRGAKIQPNDAKLGGQIEATVYSNIEYSRDLRFIVDFVEDGRMELRQNTHHNLLGRSGRFSAKTERISTKLGMERP